MSQKGVTFKRGQRPVQAANLQPSNLAALKLPANQRSGRVTQTALHEAVRRPCSVSQERPQQRTLVFISWGFSAFFQLSLTQATLASALSGRRGRGKLPTRKVSQGVSSKVRRNVRDEGAIFLLQKKAGKSLAPTASDVGRITRCRASVFAFSQLSTKHEAHGHRRCHLHMIRHAQERKERKQAREELSRLPSCHSKSVKGQSCTVSYCAPLACSITYTQTQRLCRRKYQAALHTLTQ